MNQYTLGFISHVGAFVLAYGTYSFINYIRKPKDEMSMSKRGSPKSLDEALETIRFTTGGHVAPHFAYFTVRDFMAQKFGVAYMKASDDPVAMKHLEILWDSLVKRDASIEEKKAA